MSVILFNFDFLVRWLDVIFYRTDYRFVFFIECVKFGIDIFDFRFQKIRDVDFSVIFKGDTDYVVFFCLEIFRDGYSVFIFCSIKNWCEKLVEIIVKEFYGILKKAVVDMQVN